MSHLPRKQVTVDRIAQAAERAGFKGMDRIIAVAIALAESRGGDTNAHNDSGEDSRGLWQINVAQGANPDLARFDLYDPDTNAKAAMIVYKRQGWRAWSVYKSGAWRGKLAQASAGTLAAPPAGAPGATLLSDPAGTVGGALGGIDAIGDALQKGAKSLQNAGDWLSTPANIGRVVLAVGGILVVIWGFGIIMGPQLERAAKVVSAVKP